MPNIWLASHNAGKLKEVQKIFASEKLTLRSAKEFEYYKSPKEDGTTFLENAWIKAKAFKPLVNDEDWVMAEDSGIEVEALGNLPGIHSARYAGPKASDSQNNDKMLKMLRLKQATNRSARYFCQLVLWGPDNAKFEASGECKGQIALTLKGANGFGYDPLFIPDGHEVTMAELSPKEKNLISHRKKALSELLQKLSGIADFS